MLQNKKSCIVTLHNLNDSKHTSEFQQCQAISLYHLTPPSTSQILQFPCVGMPLKLGNMLQFTFRINGIDYDASSALSLKETIAQLHLLLLRGKL